MLEVCKLCGKTVQYDEHSNDAWSLRIMKPGTEEDPGRVEHLKKQLGPYKMGERYNICVECMLQHFGVQP